MTKFLLSASGNRLAYRKSEGRPGYPHLVWFSGFNSDMTGSKVIALEAWSQAEGYPFLAFDYSGHGQSEGRFEDGTISQWRTDCLHVIDELTDGPLVLVGSSMGGWMSLLTALARPDRLCGMVLIAPAPDFTRKLMWEKFDESTQNKIMRDGVWMRPSDYGEPYPITRALIEDGATWQLLESSISLDIPIRILQGMQDADVPWSHALALVSQLTSGDVTLTLVKDGDHRLSRDQDIARLLRTIDALTSGVRASE